MKIIALSLHLGQSRMTVVVDDRRGHRRSIDFEWDTKESTNTPPKDHWISAINGEIEYQLAEEDKKASGRWLPF